MAKRICSVPSCGRGHLARGFCATHYERWRRTGDAEQTKPIITRGSVPECLADDCPIAQIEGFGYCRKHYRRLVTRGDLGEPVRGLAQDNPKWIGDRAGYRAVHTRLRKAFGKAKSHPCVDCERQAEDWSYDHEDENEGYDERGCAFSTDLTHYQPRCKKCHVAFDEVVFKAWAKRRAS